MVNIRHLPSSTRDISRCCDHNFHEIFEEWSQAANSVTMPKYPASKTFHPPASKVNHFYTQWCKVTLKWDIWGISDLWFVASVRRQNKNEDFGYLRYSRSCRWGGSSTRCGSIFRHQPCCKCSVAHSVHAGRAPGVHPVHAHVVHVQHSIQHHTALHSEKVHCSSSSTFKTGTKLQK